LQSGGIDYNIFSGLTTTKDKERKNRIFSILESVQLPIFGMRFLQISGSK